MRNKNWIFILWSLILLVASSVLFGGSYPSAQTNTTTTHTRKEKKAKGSSKSRRKQKSKSLGQNAPTPDRIKEIQLALQREGAYQGEPTGNWDEPTIDAMKKYQDEKGLNSTGKIDALTLQKLGLGSDTAGKSAPLPIASSAPSAN